MSEFLIKQALKKEFEARAAGQIQDAINHNRFILKFQPNHPEANHNLGTIAVNVGQFERALPYFKTALEGNFNSAQSWYSYIDCLMKLEMFGEADALLRSALSKGASGSQFDALKEKLDKINSRLSKEKEPSDDVINSLIKHYKNGQLNKVLNEATDLILNFPSSIQLHTILGEVYANLEQHDKAIKMFQNLINMAPNNHLTHYNLGLSLRDLNRLEEAVIAFQQVLKINSVFTDALFYMADAFLKLGKFNDAIKSLQDLLKINKDYPIANSLLGIAFFKDFKFEEALLSFKKELEISSYSPTLQSSIAAALDALGRSDEALEAYAKIISFDPKNHNAWYSILGPVKSILKKLPSSAGLDILNLEKATSQEERINKSILKYRLESGGPNALASLNECIGILSKKENLNITNTHKHKKKNKTLPSLPGRIVALYHFGRSGSGLLHSLIDGHPEVSTMPSFYFSDYFHTDAWDRITSSGWEDMVDHFISDYEILFDSSVSKPFYRVDEQQKLAKHGFKEGFVALGPQRDEILKIDKTRFKAELNRMMDCYASLNAYDFFRLVQCAYDKVIGEPSDKKITFFHIHNPPINASLNFLALEPNAEHLLIVREPVQSFESWIKNDFNKNEAHDCIQRLTKMLFEVDNTIYYRQRSTAVRLEDLKNQPQKTIPALCKWLGIRESESLYHMTVQGKEWWGDPSSRDFFKDGMDPFGKTSITREVGSIVSSKDQFIIRTLFYPFCAKFGYLDENKIKFISDLQTVRPLLDELFDFEKVIMDRTGCDPAKYMGSARFEYCRDLLIERWNVLNEYKTYPNMIDRLELE
ncbi:tetratricopeptide repeat protein [Planktomarina temperata]|jgi:tetratricopeptide (TPR) repeat protein|nr:tetratricopeptide repeat protein [Planktomarina temperata]